MLYLLLKLKSFSLNIYYFREVSIFYQNSNNSTHWPMGSETHRNAHYNESVHGYVRRNSFPTQSVICIGPMAVTFSELL